MTLSHLLSAHRLIDLQRHREDLELGYDLLEGTPCKNSGLKLLEEELAKSSSLFDAFDDAIFAAVTIEHISLRHIEETFKQTKVDSQGMEAPSSTQTPPYKPPASGYNREEHRRFYQLPVGRLAVGVLEPEEFYFTFGLELNKTHIGEVYERQERSDLLDHCYKKRLQLAKSMVALELIVAITERTPKGKGSR